MQDDDISRYEVYKLLGPKEVPPCPQWAGGPVTMDVKGTQNVEMPWKVDLSSKS